MTHLDDIDCERMVELWAGRIRATTDFERGYYQGRFEEYAAQNAIDAELFPSFREAALVVVEQAHGEQDTRCIHEQRGGEARCNGGGYDGCACGPYAPDRGYTLPERGA